jgi:hypothetical protein
MTWRPPAGLKGRGLVFWTTFVKQRAEARTLNPLDRAMLESVCQLLEKPSKGLTAFDVLRRGPETLGCTPTTRGGCRRRS